MKKIIAILTAAVLMIGICIPVMAEKVPSPEKDVQFVSAVITTEDGKQIEISSIEDLNNYAEISNKPAQDVSEPVQGQTTLKGFDIKLKDGIKKADIVVNVPGVQANKTYTVQQYVNGKWVTVDAVVIGDNKIKITTEGSGTFRILTEKSDDPGQNEPGNNPNENGGGSGTDNNGGSSTTGSNTSSTSPKTGETSAFPAACALFAVFALTAVFAGFKAKKIS